MKTASMLIGQAAEKREQDEANRFLDQLRESGAVNMFGARPYLAEAFGWSQRKAGEMLAEWMRTFEERSAR